MASATRKLIGTHFVIRVVIEQINMSGNFEYGSEVPNPGTESRVINELGNAVAKDKDLKAVIEKAKAHLDLMGQ